MIQNFDLVYPMFATFCIESALPQRRIGALYERRQVVGENPIDSAIPFPIE